MKYFEQVMKKICIFGGGIGGLTVAHQLAKDSRYEIHLYESTNVLGGLARSSRDSNNHPIELCWRVFFGFYHNLLKIIKEIPGTENIFTDYKHLNVNDSPSGIKTYLSGLYNAFYGFTACDERLLKMESDKLSWYNALENSLSDFSIGSENTNPTGLEKDIFKDVGPWLGMDRYKASYMSVVKVGMEMQMFPAFLDPWYKDFVTTEPTSEALFDKWYDFLKDQVHFHFNTSLIGLTGTEKIESAIVKSSSEIQEIKADHYVLSVPVQVLSNIINFSPPSLYNHLYKTKELTDTCLHLQPCFQLFFNRKMSLNGKNAFLVIDSPWDLIVISYDQTYLDDISLGSKAKGGWSIAACTIYRPGLNGKPMTECSEDEIKEELINQLVSSKMLMEIVEKNNDTTFLNSISGWGEMWPTYKTLPLRSTEPKFTNNAGSYNSRPSYKTNYSNLFIATGYVKETIDIFSMEAACIAGKYAAFAINGKEYPIKVERPLIFWPFRKLDEIFYCIGLPNLNLVLLLIVFIILIYFFFRFIISFSHSDS